MRVIPTVSPLSSETDRNNFQEMRSLSLSHLQFWAGDQPCSPCSGHLPRLPPVVVVLADDLQDVPGVEGDPRLSAGDEIIVQGVVLELGSNKDVAGRRSRAVGGNDLR